MKELGTLGLRGMAGAVIMAAIAAFIFSLFLAPAAKAQALPAGSANQARYLANFEFGADSGLGYYFPSLGFGLSTEIPLGNGRLEAQSAFQWSPDRKYITNDGNQLGIGAGGILWATRSVGAYGTVGYSKLWTSQFNKSGWVPAAGFVVRDRWFGFPGRAYFDYLFPTGCQWATASNPCTIMSNRSHGVAFSQEFRLYPHWRFGVNGAWVSFADQGNPLQPMPRVWHNTGTAYISITYEFRSGSLDEAY